MFHIDRSYDKYTFTFENNRSIVIDINSTDPIIGVSGKPLKSKPIQLRESMVGSYIYTAYLNHEPNFPNRNYFDRIVSLPEFTDEQKENLLDIIVRMNDCREEDWREFLRYIRNGMLEAVRRESCFGFYSSLNAINRCKVYESCVKLGLEKLYRRICDANPLAMEVVLANKYLRKSFREVAKDKYAPMQTAIRQQFFGDLTEEEICAMYGVRFDIYNPTAHLGNMVNHLDECCKFCTRMNIDPKAYPFTNLHRDYESLKMRYEENQTRYQNEFFSRNQDRKNLYYENKEYEIYVPHSRQELNDIGLHFRNCANGWEWQHRLENGDFDLVVVRRKMDDRMMVCVDIKHDTMCIGQYYGVGNNDVREQALRDFRHEYQQYLNNL